MKRMIAAAVITAVLGLPACGREEEHKGPVPRQAVQPPGNGPAVPAREPIDTSLNSRLNAIQQAPNRQSRISAITRAAHVPEEEKPQMVAVLIDMFNNTRDPQERYAVMASLIAMGTDEALQPVKEALLFSGDQQLNAVIIDMLKKSYHERYKEIINGWCVELLGSPAVLQKYKEVNVLHALSLLQAVFDPAFKTYLDAAPFLTYGTPRMKSMMYDLLPKYPADRIPVEVIGQQVNEGFIRRSPEPGMLRLAANLAAAGTVDAAAFKIGVPAPDIMAGLISAKPEVRETSVMIAGLAYPNLDRPAQAQIKSLMVDLAESDPYFMEGQYIVRERAAAILQKLD